MKQLRIPPTPPFASGMRIGLFGGSFDPAHAGHLLVSRIALQRFRLHRIWWLATPGNPLKSTDALAPLACRMAAARRLARDPRIIVTDIEAAIDSRYTIDVISYLRRRCLGVSFVWIMGADNLAQFHRWRRWRDIARLMPIAVIDRPGSTMKAMRSHAAQTFQSRRMSAAAKLPGARPPAYVFLQGPRLAISSTQLRTSLKNQG